jgi:hypothetical protein
MLNLPLGVGAGFGVFELPELEGVNSTSCSSPSGYRLEESLIDIIFKNYSKVYAKVKIYATNYA